MKQNWKKIGNKIVGIIIALVAVGVLSWLAWELFNNTSSDIVIAIITASIILLGSIIMVVYWRSQEKEWGDAENIFVGIIIISVVSGFLVWFGWKLYKSASSDIVAATITASITFLGSVIIVVYSRSQEKIREIAQEHRTQKIPIYRNLLEYYFGILADKRTGAKKPSKTKNANFHSEFNKELILWGSDDVINKYTALVKKTQSPENHSSTDLVFHFEQLLLLMRGDLGHKNQDIQKGDLVRLFINDIDKHLESRDTT